MRWSISSQLLSPVVLLLLSVAGISCWTARNATMQARGQIEDRLRNVARFVEDEARFPLEPNVLRWMKSLSGAEYLLVSRSRGELKSSLDLASEGSEPEPTVPVVGDWRVLHLGARLEIEGACDL